MKNITSVFEDVYLPKAILLFHNDKEDHCYVEAYDIDGTGRAMNAHPLSVEEAMALSKVLEVDKETEKSFLRPEGLLPDNVLHINPSAEGAVIWYTQPQQRQLFFKKNLGVPNGKAYVPALLWKATEEELVLYALKAKGTPALNTPLYDAPFFNMYKSGKVCMGTVSIEKANSLETFICSWEDYFFNSYFSHLINEHNSVKDNIVQLWQQQVSSQKQFPNDSLKKTGLTIQNLIR